MNFKTTLCLLVLTALQTSYAIPSAVFHTPFDQDFSAVTYAGQAEGKHSAEILWENIATYLHDGVEGKAALIGTGADKSEDYHITYANKNYITPEKGSVVFWVRPEDWNGNDRKFHVFFRAEGNDTDLLVYKGPWSSNLIFLIGPKRKEGGKNIWTESGASIADWKPGEWHFVAATWGNGEIKLYVDGLCKEKRKYKVVASNPFVNIGIGGLRPKAWATPQDHSLIDELMLYNCALTEADVLARYGSYRQSRINARDEKTVAPQQISTGWNPRTDNMDFIFSVRHVAPDGKFYRVDTRIEDANGKTVYSNVLDPQSSEFHLALPEKSFAPGDYTLKLTVLKKDSSLNQTITQPFSIPKRPEMWRGNTIGMSQTTPAPWTTPQWEEGKGVFSCWNRRYIFGKSGLPEQILSGSIPLLARPVELRMDGKKVDLGAAVMTSKNGERIDLSASGKAGDFSSKMKLYGEFDGFFWVDLELKPNRPTSSFRNLTLDFAFQKEQSTLFNAMIKQYSDYVPGHAGAFKSYSLDLFQTLSRTIFVGNEKVGLEWFCEELSSWKLRRYADSLQLIPGEKENLLRLTFADLPVKPGEVHRYRFGFQALPVKPLPEKWRLVRAHSKEENAYQPWFSWSEIHNIPDPETKAADYEARLKKAMRKGPNVHWYFAGFSNSPYTREWSFYGPLWSQTPPAVGTVGEAHSREWAFVRNCPVAPGYIDYYIYNLKRTVEALNIENLYFDNQDAQFCDNALHGCGWKGTDGNTYRTFNLLATRELAKRIYRMFKEEARTKGKKRICRHMSTKTVTPVIGFSDFIVDGEIYCGTVGRDEHYRNIFSPAMFRAMFMTSPYGIPRYFAPQFQRAIRWHSPIRNRYQTAWRHDQLDNHRDVLRHFNGYMYVHDGLIWPEFGISCDSWWKIQDDFGFNGKERFILYDDPASPFQSHGRVMVSCYVLGKRSLIIAMNDEKVPLKFLPFSTKKFEELGVRISSLTDAETGKTADVKDGVIVANIPPQDYRIWVSQ